MWGVYSPGLVTTQQSSYDNDDDEGDDDDDDDDNRAGKFLHRDAALGLHENTSATLGVHLQFEKGGRWSVEEEKT